MKNVLSAASAAAILLAAGMALAQEQQVPGAPAGPAQGVPAQGEVAPDVNVNVDTIVAALETTPAEIHQLPNLEEGATLEFVDINEYLAAPGQERLETAMDGMEDRLGALHWAIENNEILTALLESENVPIADVIGFEVAGNSVLIITRPGSGPEAPASDGGGGAGLPAPEGPGAPPVGGAPAGP